MNRYESFWYEKEGEQICQLRDNECDCLVEIAVTFGLNVIRYSYQGTDILLQPPSLAILKEIPFRYGIPFLSPPGRTTKGKFKYRGIEYQLPLSSGEHNVHGELGKLPWRAVRFEADAKGGVSLQATYGYKEDPERYAYFPHDMEYDLTYRLREGELSLEGVVRNEGSQYAPFSLGFHPYFEFSGSRDEVMLQLPARAQWPMERGGVKGAPFHTDLVASLQTGMALKEIEGDLHFIQMEAETEDEEDERISLPYLCRMVDSYSNLRIDFRVSSLFSTLVLFLPSWGNSVALEPHSCVPDAFNLPIPNQLTGIRELAPGEGLKFGWQIEVERLGESHK